MPVLSASAQRVREPEIMDDPNLDRARHVAALRGLANLNLVSGSARHLWSPIARLAAGFSDRPLRVLDIATGGGDIPIALWAKAQRKHVAVEILGVDKSECAVAFARQRAQQRGAEVEFRALDALDDELPSDFDVLMCSLFLHHLSDEEAVLLLENMARAARRLVLVNDLVRSAANVALVRLGSQIVSRSDVVHVDGPLSVKAAFTLDEVRLLAQRAGLTGASVAGRWPCRYLLEWSKP